MIYTTKKGNLTVVTGCMFAGKSTKLIELANKEIGTGRIVKVCKPAIDSRYAVNKVVTHDGVSIEAIVLEDSNDLANLQNTQVVLIDEVQFCDKNILEIIKQLLNQGVDVIAGGLNSDFRAEPFENTTYLMSFADEIYHLKAKCDVCGQPAVLTQRIIDGQPAKRTDPVILVGGSDSYEARCRSCHVVG